MWWGRRLQRIEEQLTELARAVRLLTRQAQIQGGIVMSQLDELRAEVARNTAVDASAKTLIEGLAVKIQDLINAGAGHVSDEALQELVNSLRADNDALSAAVAENTAAEPTPEEPPAEPTPEA
jgi:hypothetical protein